MQAGKSLLARRLRDTNCQVNRMVFHKHRGTSKAPMAGIPSFSPGGDDPAVRLNIISVYLKSLDKCKATVGREADLPFPKPLIRQAILNELMENPASEMRDQLEIAYSQLETFLPPEEHAVLRGFQIACAVTREITKSGKPRDIIASARLMNRCEGNRAVEIHEKIFQRMRRRREEIRSIG